MFITALEVHGLRDLPRFRADGLDRVVRVRGPSPAWRTAWLERSRTGTRTA